LTLSTLLRNPINFYIKIKKVRKRKLVAFFKASQVGPNMAIERLRNTHYLKN
jgi:hypothetical protein